MKSHDFMLLKDDQGLGGKLSQQSVNFAASKPELKEASDCVTDAGCAALQGRRHRQRLRPASVQAIPVCDPA